MIQYILLSVVFVLLFVLWRNQITYWSKRNIKGPMPLPIIGNFGRMALMKQSFGDLLKTLYTKYPEEKVIGFHCGVTPLLLIRDPDLINHVLITDFNNFVNRGINTCEEGFYTNLFIAEGEIWKVIRQKLTPIFTATKLKQMINLMQSCTHSFISKIDDATTADRNLNIRNVIENCTLDIVSSCLFGLKLDFYNGTETEIFKSISHKLIKPSLFFRLSYVAELLIPGIQKRLKLDPTPHIREFFLKLTNTLIDLRVSNDFKRHDIIDTLIKLREEGKIKSNNDPLFELEIDENVIAAQAFAMYTAGIDTTASTIAFLLYELSLYPEFQDKVYKEICQVLNKYDQQLNYEAVMEMSYLQSVLNETLRKYNSIEWIIRKSAKDYTFPGTDIRLPSNSFIVISNSGLHYDAKYFANPMKFNPENCTRENLKNIPQCAFLPFGIGPRNCIGLRFAMLTLMVVTVTFLRKFEVKPCNKSKQDIKYDSNSMTKNATDGIWINISKRK